MSGSLLKVLHPCTWKRKKTKKHGMHNDTPLPTPDKAFNTTLRDVGLLSAGTH
jgi:hypothetical protein